MDIAHWSAAELRRRIDARELSPVEVVDAALARIDRYNGIVNAVVTLSESAVEDARQLERRLARGEDPGPLCGLPVGIKDVTPVAHLRTTFGSPMFADYVPEEDAVVVRRLRRAGAVIVGKTNCPEFAAGGNTFNDVFGATRNPWDPRRSAGGSTGGGAAALATGMIALAEGTDLGGSLRVPASCCGVVGLRPSPGLVPTYPNEYLWDHLQATGPMARTAEDVALMLQAIAGPSEFSPIHQAVSGRDFVEAVARGPAASLRVAYTADIAGIGIDPKIERVCHDAVEALTTSGMDVEAIELDLAFAREAFLALRGLWFVAQLFPHLDRREEFGPNVGANVETGLQLTSRDIAAAEHARSLLWQRFRELFITYDHVLTPCMAIQPFPVEQNYPETIAGKPMKTYVDWIAPTFTLSLTGLPVAAVPCGVDDAGLPVGLQIVGKPSGEEAVLALAQRIQELRPIGVPPLSALDRMAARLGG